MGLFKPKTFSVGCASECSWWKCPKLERAELVKGDARVTVYTYDPLPIAGADPAGFPLDIMYMDATLRSTVNGTVTRIDDPCSVVVGVGGMPVGFMPMRREFALQAAKRGTILRVAAFQDGWLEFGGVSIRRTFAGIPKEWRA